MWAYRQSGWLLVGIGAFHCAIGVLLSWDVLSQWHQAGWWYSVERGGAMHMDRFAALWFQVSGVSWIVMGWLMQQWLTRLGALPAAVGWALLLMGALVAYVLPMSGAWLFVALGLLLIGAPARKARL